MKKSSVSKIIIYVCTLLVVVGGVIFWTSDLTLDPPMYFSGLGQSLSTDPAQYVYHARNNVVFDDPDPFDYPRWLVYQRSLTSLTAHIWFKVAGVSLKQANMVGLLLAIGGLILFLLAVGRHHRPWVMLIIALVYLANVSLFVHGRLSYLENGLIFITALLFFVYSWWGGRKWGPILCGVLVALAMLMGKLFGVLLLPALVLAEWFSARDDRIRRIVTVLAAFFATVIVLVFSLYGSHLSAVSGYFGEQSYGLRGFPAGLSSPLGFIEHLISYGFANRLFFLDGDIYAFLWWGGFLLTYLLLGRVKLSSLSPVTLLAMFAAPCIFLGLMPLNYSPVRYSLFFIPVVILFCFSLSDHMLIVKSNRPARSGYVKYILLFVLFWQTLFQLVSVMFYVNDTESRIQVWYTLPFAIAITLLVRYLFNRYKFTIGRKAVIAGIVLGLLISALVNSQHFAMRVFASRGASLLEANDDLEEILGDKAVVSGPYGPVLTLDTKLKSFIHLFGVASVDSTLFERYPITHLAIDSSNWLEAVKNYPQLTDMQPITAYWIRDFGVKIANVSKHVGNAEAVQYEETAYERAAFYYSQGDIDSAFASLREFLSEKPNNRSANLLLADIYLNKGRFAEAATVLRNVASLYPNDYYTNLICGRSLQIIGMIQRNNNVIALARKYYERAVQSNPFRAMHARTVYEQTRRQYSAPAPQGEATP